MAFKLPALPYDHDVLEPVIDATTMEIHHQKHHGGYVEKLNKAVSGTQWESLPVEELLTRLDELPEKMRIPVRNNGGGHFNHSLFWKTLAPPSSGGGGEPDGPLAEAIDAAFGSFKEFQEAFTECAKSRFGSGWAWLYADPERRLHVTSTANQDACIMPVAFGGLGTGHVPLLGLDVWEHAYYLTYQNRRPEYIEKWWTVVSWDAVAENLARTRQKAGAAAG